MNMRTSYYLLNYTEKTQKQMQPGSLHKEDENRQNCTNLHSQRFHYERSAPLYDLVALLGIPTDFLESLSSCSKPPLHGLLLQAAMLRAAAPVTSWSPPCPSLSSNSPSTARPMYGEVPSAKPYLSLSSCDQGCHHEAFTLPHRPTPTAY